MSDEETRGNVKVESVRSYLEERVRSGRTPLEAAGEKRWLSNLEQSVGILSMDSRDTILGVVDEWLAEKMDVPVEKVGPYRMVAESYAQFLAERVSFDLKDYPIAMIESAWQEWRDARGGT